MIKLEQRKVVLNNALYQLVPTELYLFSDGSLMFVPPFAFAPTYEYCPEGVSSAFDSEGFTLWEKGSKEYRYDYQTAYRYKSEPLMAGWIRQQGIDKSQLSKRN